MHLKVWKITTHKHSLRRNFPVGKLDICYAIALKVFEDLAEKVVIVGQNIYRDSHTGDLFEFIVGIHGHAICLTKKAEGKERGLMMKF